MSGILPVRSLVLVIIVFALISAGCTSAPAQPRITPVPQGTGTLHVSSVPAGAEVYLDGEYQSFSPAAISPVPAGHHQVEFRMNGYDPVSYPVTVVKGGMEGIRVTLVHRQTIIASGSTPAPTSDRLHISVSGDWAYQQKENKSADPDQGKYSPDPIPFLLHIESMNGGTTDARDVTASANLYNEGRIICRNPVDIGPLAAGSHISRDILVTCTIPDGYIDQNLVVLVENVTIQL
jgi:hypothetical protein